MSNAISQSVAISGAFLACCVLPWLGMRALLPTMREGRLHVSNYRGRSVTPGLGVVWVWWSGGVLLLLAGDTFLSFWDGYSPLMVVAVVAVMGSFVFGLIDDVFGAGTDKGFSGHIGALREGKLTTGLLKLMGIGLVSLLLGGGMALYAQETPFMVAALVRGAVIALSANAMNLFDLRPGRALKVFSFDALILLLATPLITYRADTGIELWPLALLVPVLGPVVAIWRYDLTEVGMLGDAGANPMGALLGVTLAALWPIWAVAVAAGILLLVNLLSERWSFSAVIEGNGLLRAVDRLGRID